jgi:hypothetical protein
VGKRGAGVRRPSPSVGTVDPSVEADTARRLVEERLRPVPERLDRPLDVVVVHPSRGASDDIAAVVAVIAVVPAGPDLPAVAGAW